jgi:zinc-ribbon domain
MAACSRCGKDVEATFRFCPWCGLAQRSKLVEFFRPHPNSAGRALRVSRYFGEEPQVRFSVWDDGVARAAVSLDEAESRRLAAFLAAGPTQPRPATRLPGATWLHVLAERRS